MITTDTGRTLSVVPRLLNVPQAAVYLGRSEKAVRHLISKREFPAVRAGSRLQLDKEDIDKWIERNKR